MKPLKLPPPLKPGDLVCGIAPSGAVRELERLETGCAIWRSRGYRVELAPNWASQWGYLAGNDESRRQDLAWAWQDPDCRAIVAVRGGYGSARVLEDWRWGSQDLKWLIGFSDVTGLLWSLATMGISSLHGAVLTTLGSEPEWSQDRLFNYLEGQPLEPLEGEGWVGGQATGVLLPGNLTVATHLLNTPIQPDFAGVILALEDVKEAPYRLDRMLTMWRSLGVFQQVVGIALGRFSRCEASNAFPSWTVAEVLRDRLMDLKIPIVANLPFGHDGPNAVLPLGQVAHLNGDLGILTF